MKKIEISSRVLAIAAIILFWIFGFNGNNKISGIMLIIAGCGCWLMLICRFINWRRNRWLA